MNIQERITQHRKFVKKQYGADLCMEWMARGCVRGGRCRFLHIPSAIQCDQFNQTGECPRGRDCPFRHIMRRSVQTITTKQPSKCEKPKQMENMKKPEQKQKVIAPRPQQRVNNVWTTLSNTATVTPSPPPQIIRTEVFEFNLKDLQIMISKIPSHLTFRRFPPLIIDHS
jgi:hypothetical protein